MIALGTAKAALTHSYASEDNAFMTGTAAAVNGGGSSPAPD